MSNIIQFSTPYEAIEYDQAIVQSFLDRGVCFSSESEILQRISSSKEPLSVSKSRLPAVVVVGHNLNGRFDEYVQRHFFVTFESVSTPWHNSSQITQMNIFYRANLACTYTSPNNRTELFRKWERHQFSRSINNIHMYRSNCVSFHIATFRKEHPATCNDLGVKASMFTYVFGENPDQVKEESTWFTLHK